MLPCEVGVVLSLMLLMLDRITTSVFYVKTLFYLYNVPSVFYVKTEEEIDQSEFFFIVPRVAFQNIDLTLAPTASITT